MSLVREQGSEIITQFNVPIRGTWKNIAAHTLPVDAVYDSLNVFIREGKLRNRPGLTLYDDTTFLEPVLGGVMLVTPTEHIILGITRNRVYQLSSVTQVWDSITLTGSLGTVIAPNDTSVVDMAVMETAGEYIALIAQQDNVLKKWSDSPRLLEVLTGTNIPRAKSVCIAASRVVALVYPHTVVWSATLNPASFDAIAYAKRAQTGDEGVCVRSLTALSFVLYKERSIHMARAQAGLDEGTAFSFSEPIYIEGPAGIYAVVNVNGVHYYMTRNGRIAKFDGTAYPQWIADGLWLFLQEDINQALVHMIRGIYDYRLHTITFFYPKVSETGILRGMVIINLPFEGQDIAEPAVAKAFLGLCEKSIVHACEKRWNDTIDRSMLFSSPLDTQDRSQAYIVDETTNMDEDLHFTCSFQTGLQAMPDARHTQVTVETFMERGQRYGAVLIEPVISDALETPGGTVAESSGQYVDLEYNPIVEYKGFNKIMRFFGLRYTWRSDNKVRYSGTVVYSSSTPGKKKV
jgi:hypothetical protein